MLKNHILSAFGQRQSETITALEVRDHIRLIGETRRETARKALALIKEILRHGVTIGLLQYNVARELAGPAVVTCPMRHLTTPEDIGDALLAIDRLLPYLVLRPGELAGLEWRGNRRRHHPQGQGSDEDAARTPLPHSDTGASHPRKPVPAHRPHRARLLQRHHWPPHHHRRRLHHEAPRHQHHLPRLASCLFHPHERAGLRPRPHRKAAKPHRKNSIRDIYNHADYLDQRRAMLQAWADWLDELKRQARH
jgi:phage integrase family site-specific recombinase